MIVEEWAALGGGIASGVVVCWRVGKRIVCQASDTQRKLDAILRDGEELHPNAGTSLRDAVNRIESGMVFTGAKLRASFEQTGVDAFEANQRGEWTAVFGSFADQVGLDDDDLLGSGWVNSLAETTRGSTHSEWEASVRTGRDIRLSLTTKHSSSGAIQRHRILARRLVVNGSPVGFFGVIERQPPTEN